MATAAPTLTIAELGSGRELELGASDWCVGGGQGMAMIVERLS